jgi:hypothetical protein
MRAGPLSNDEVIALLNRYFVPIYVVNEDYRKGGPAPAEEKAEVERIYHAALKAGLSTGTVHVYIVTPEGAPVDSLHVAEAAKTEKLLALLKGTIGKFKVSEGKPLFDPRPQSAPPPVEEGGQVLHLTARGFSKGSWREFPAENWIVLKREEAEKLLPTVATAEGAGWEIPREAAARILTYFYPQTENNDVSKNRLEKAALRGTVTSLEGNLAKARLTGDLRMQHSFYPNRPDEKFVEAAVVGYLWFEPESRKIRAFEIVTEDAVYGKEKFAAALALNPSEAPTR